MVCIPTKREAEAQQSVARVFLHLGAPEKGKEDAYYNEEVGVILYLDGENLAGDGGADVGSHDHADGLGERHEPGIHEADRHDRGGAAALDEHRNASPNKYPHERGFGQSTYQLPETIPGDELQGLTDQLDGEEEKPNSSEKLDDALYGHAHAP